MPPEIRGKLLRVLEDGEVWRIGAGQGKKVDVRVLAATNADLQRKIQEGAFRRDLYFRLARFTVTAPPLRERREDIPLLARHFLRLFAEEMGREASVLSPEAIHRLTDYNFPGNVRELKNIIERALIESGGAEIEPHHLHFLSREKADSLSTSSLASALPGLPMDLNEAARQAERWVVEQAMKQADGNLSEAARLLGTSRNTLYRVINTPKT
jgi:DNA-binding NtrC family response regulator